MIAVVMLVVCVDLLGAGESIGMSPGEVIGMFPGPVIGTSPAKVETQRTDVKATAIRKRFI